MGNKVKDKMPFYGVLHKVLPYKELTNKIVLCREILCSAVNIGYCAVNIRYFAVKFCVVP